MQHTKKQGFSDVFQHSFGFSLVELIMTMAILAVVGIIGFTSFNGVTEKRENSRRVSDVEMFRNTVDTMVLQSGEVPEPTANRQFYKVSGAYAHSASGAVGVSSYLSPDILGKFAHADHPRDPKTGSFYGFGKSYSKKGEYQIAAVITGSDGPRALVQGRYTGGQGTNFGDIPGLVKAYNSSEFLIDGDSEGLPYNPTEKVVTASIIESSGSVQVSGGKPITAALMEGDILTVGTGSTATIKISDGTEAVIGSESNETIVTLSELALKDDTGLLTRVKLSLGSGRILAKAPKLREISEGERSDMQIESGGAVAAVRGTILGVDAGEGGSGKIRTVTLIEGKIQMIGSTGGDGGGNTGGGDVNGNTGNTEDGNPIRVYTSSVSGTPYPTSNSVSPTFSQSGVIEVQEGGNPISVSYVAQKSSAAGGNTSSDTGYTNPDIISSPPSGDTTALERVKQITASYTGTLAKLDQPSIAGKMIAPIHMSMTGSLGYSGGVGGAITSPTDGTVLTWANTVFTSNITGTSPGTGSMELRYETKVVGMSDVKVVVIGNIVQGAKLLTGTGGDNGVMYPENSEIAYRHVNKILRRLDPVYSGTGNIFIGDLSSITPTTSIVSGTTGNGYAYSGRTVHIPLKIDHNARTYSPDEKVSFMLCKKGENGVWCTKPYNVTVDAWMVGSAPLAYSRVGTKKMEMGMKVAEQVEDSTVSADSKECKNNGWSEEICAKTGNAGKDPTLVGITAFMGGCVTIQTPNGPTSTNSGDLNLYMLQSPGTHPRMIKANIMTDKVAKDKDTDSGDGGECTTASGTFSQGGIVLDRSALDDYLHYDVSSLIGAGKFRMEIEVNCADLFRLKASSTTNGNIYTLVQDSKDTTINITTGTLYGNKLNFPRFGTPGSTEKSSPLNLDDKCRVKIHRNTSNQYKTTIVNISNGSPIFSSTGTTIANFSGKFYIGGYKDGSYKGQWDAPIYSISIYNTD